MRAIGPGSVASLLKIALDCAYWVLVMTGIVMIVIAIGFLLALPFLSGLHSGDFTLDGRPANMSDILRRWPAIETLLLTATLYVAALVVIINRLRRVFETLTQGDPFRPENVGRLRVIGLSLIGLEVIGWLVRMASLWLLPEKASRLGLSVSFSGWFAILSVFVLAEVFREGARLRSDAELTI
jgi:hypothetical protein